MLRAHPTAKTKKKQPLRFIATCASGLEPLVSEEIASFGGEEIAETPGAVSWTGNLETGYRACLWSRFASRILLELARFDAPDPDALYTHAGTILWDDHFTVESTFAVHTTLVNATLNHSQFASLRIKDAIVDQFRKRFGKRPDVECLCTRYPHQSPCPGNRCLAVPGSFGREPAPARLSHRQRRGAAQGNPGRRHRPSLRLAGTGRNEPILLDPMCGGGTLLIEAALMLSHSAPGLLRKTFGFMAWNKHDPQLWERLVQEALDRESESIPEPWPQFIGYDADPKVVAAARKNVIAAGLRDVIVIKQRQLARLQSPGPRGCMLTNPPYGERLSDKEAVKYLYRCLGPHLSRPVRRLDPGLFHRQSRSGRNDRHATGKSGTGSSTGRSSASCWWAGRVRLSEKASACLDAGSPGSRQPRRGFRQPADQKLRYPPPLGKRGGDYLFSHLRRRYPGIQSGG